MSDQAKEACGSSATERYAEALLPTEHGEFRMLVYRSGDDEAVALVSGDLTNTPVLVRVHSECMTGEVLGSLRCDCRAQLNLALARISKEGGVLVYLRQEGRGIGLGNKIRAYALQDEGRDTVDANLDLGFEADSREYVVAVEIIADLGIGAVRLMTNNPDKVAQLAAAGVAVTAEPHWAAADARSNDYIKTKQARLGHTGDPSAVNNNEEPTST